MYQCPSRTTLPTIGTIFPLYQPCSVRPACSTNARADGGPRLKPEEGREAEGGGNDDVVFGVPALV